jgi:RimJ/RimL family protein N-acetyltransferase
MSSGRCKARWSAGLAAPSTLAGFRGFIDWAIGARQAGRYISLVAVPTGGGTPVGFLQLWPLQRDFAVAEWGFALARSHWGARLFDACSRLVIDFAFSTLGVRRVDARAAAANAWANSVLQRVGAVLKMVMRKCFPCWDGVYQDHVMWSIISDEAPTRPVDEDGSAWALRPLPSYRSPETDSQPSLFGQAPRPTTQTH